MRKRRLAQQGLREWWAGNQAGEEAEDHTGDDGKDFRVLFYVMGN